MVLVLERVALDPNDLSELTGDDDQLSRSEAYCSAAPAAPAGCDGLALDGLLKVAVDAEFMPDPAVLDRRGGGTGGGRLELDASESLGELTPESVLELVV